MQITAQSKAKLIKLCEDLRRVKKKVSSDPRKMSPSPKQLKKAMGDLREKLRETQGIKFEWGVKQSKFFDVGYVPGGRDHLVVPIMEIFSVESTRADSRLLLTAWFDSESHAHITVLDGRYKSVFRYATSEDLAGWIIDYLVEFYS